MSTDWSGALVVGGVFAGMCAYVYKPVSRARLILGRLFAEPFDADEPIDSRLTESQLVLVEWSRASAGLPVRDHAACEGPDCDRTICCCPSSVIGEPCPGTTAQVCDHHSLLCDGCWRECLDCRVDAMHDAGLLG